MPDRPPGLAARFSQALPSLEQMDGYIYRGVAFGFPLLTMVIITGAVWAQYVWQRWWSWDPKETASLVTWLIYAGYLHGRRERGWQGRASAGIVLGGFLAVLFTFAGVNFLQSLHAYGLPHASPTGRLWGGFGGVSPVEAALTVGFYLCYLLGFVAALGGAVRGRQGGRVALVLAALGLAANTAVLIWRMVEARRVTFTSGYDFSLWFVWGIALCGLVAALRKQLLALLGTLPLALLIAMYGYLYFPHKGRVALPPALQNKLWLHLHVALAIFAYGALALAAGWSMIYLLKSALDRRGRL
jgi:ABC-type transport system involved in cytochrome c biogenesis permease subunit